MKTSSSYHQRKFFSLRGWKGCVLVLLQVVSSCIVLPLSAQNTVRTEIPLPENWSTIAQDPGQPAPKNFEQPAYRATGWATVSIPHNWDRYEGYRRLLHGNRHGTAWYRKSFSLAKKDPEKRYFLFFEGVGSYATVWLNGKLVGQHAGGRTTFTLDVTRYIHAGSKNLLAVRAGHPPHIRDLPWVCGGCSEERGFSEGSQPMGIFRPVTLVITSDVRIEPFGVHAWSGTDVQPSPASLQVATTLKNYSHRTRTIDVVQELRDATGVVVRSVTQSAVLQPHDSVVLQQKNISVAQPRLWSVEDPYLYTIHTGIRENGKLIDRTETKYGFRTISWPVGKPASSNRFLLNGKPVWINGIAEYEHLLGQSHAFSREQINSRMKWIRFAGFNAFRDAHQPHHLLYGSLCDSLGLLWWTQLSAHVWYDTPEFRKQFKTLLREWVIERRNNPSVVLWGLQNESKLPEDFARECTELIRELDPTTSSQRLVTTCNGGSGTDWDVPQNWTGTYGGDPAAYAQDVKKQVLIGEYGAWRTLDLHTEGNFDQNGPLSENRMTQLMEQKVRLAESVKDSSCGQFFWLLTSHDNPGRVQGGEGLRELDRVGPVNYKGLLTPWEQPLDVFYMFRANYAPAETEPMVYIVSHTWPGRWTAPGVKDSIIIYSNCEEVELFNDLDAQSLGKKKRKGPGTHFQWDGAAIRYNVLYAVGYVNGKPAAKDTIVLHHLPPAPAYAKRRQPASDILRPQPGWTYIYRVNCGGPDYRDKNGFLWMADRALQPDREKVKRAAQNNNVWGSVSWTDSFPGLPAFFASQQRSFDPVKGTGDQQLFQTFRYGRDQLQYMFPLPDGMYRMELYFMEPWLGIGGGMDATGMRLFDVAVNKKVVLKDLDIWKESGTHTALKKVFNIQVTGGQLLLSFPRCASGQAVISAIAIASQNTAVKRAAARSVIGQHSTTVRRKAWLDIGDTVFYNAALTFRSLPSNLYGAEWLQHAAKHSEAVSCRLQQAADVFVAVNKTPAVPAWLQGFEDTRTEIETNEPVRYPVYRKRFAKGANLQLPADGGTLALFVLPVTRIPPAYDLKIITPYRMQAAAVSAGVLKEEVQTRLSALVKTDASAFIEWPVQTGVADRYSITLKYYYPKEKVVSGKIQLFDAGNTMMHEEAVRFNFTRPGKWNQLTVDTGSQINAGNYRVRLVVDHAAGLAVSGIDIQ